MSVEPRPLPRGVEELLAEILAAQAVAMRANLPGAVDGADPERVHDLRVATRRARAALALFADLVDAEAGRALRDELRWLAQVAGAVRDLDVFASRLELLLGSVEAPVEVRRLLGARIQRRRAPARRALVEALAAPRCAQVLDRLDALVATLLTTPPSALAGSAVVPLLRRALRPVQRMRLHKLPRLPDADLHALRIQGKRARYACEFCAGVSPVDPEPARAALVRLQDLLGAHQDAAVSEDWLRGWLRDLGRSRVRGAARDARMLTAGALLQAERDRRAALRRELPGLAPGVLEAVACLRAALKVHRDGAPDPGPTSARRGRRGNS